MADDSEEDGIGTSTGAFALFGSFIGFGLFVIDEVLQANGYPAGLSWVGFILVGAAVGGFIGLLLGAGQAAGREEAKKEARPE